MKKAWKCNSFNSIVNWVLVGDGIVHRTLKRGQEELGIWKLDTHRRGRAILLVTKEDAYKVVAII